MIPMSRRETRARSPNRRHPGGMARAATVPDTPETSMLAHVPLFGGLGPDDLAEIERQTALKRYRKHTVVIEKDDESQALYLLVSGTVKVFVSDEAGKEIVLRELGPGDHFGELALLGGSRRTASVMTLSDCEMRLLTGETFRTLLGNRPELAFQLIRDLARRVTELTERVSDLALLNVYGRVAKVLIESAANEGGREITQPLTQQAIADRVGCSREMVSRILTDLKTGGYVSTEGKRFILNKKLPQRW
jgi:CRP/FNR family cyclic AMP-dependent transcriptional regulator